MNEEQNQTCCHHPAKGALAIVLVIVGILLVIYLGALARNALKNYDYIGQSPDIKDRVIVEGTGKVAAASDVAVISIGVITDKSTVAQAQKENTEKMNAITKALKDGFKIEDKDIKTSQYSINPKYDWTSGSQKIIGYTVNQSVEIKVRDFDKIGDILAKAAALGTNSLNGPTFTIDDPEVYKAQAREKAIAQAKEKAKVLADQVGIKLGKIVSFSENFGGDNIAVKYRSSLDFGLGGATESAAPAPDIQAGSEEVVVNVAISYEIK